MVVSQELTYIARYLSGDKYKLLSIAAQLPSKQHMIYLSIAVMRINGSHTKSFDMSRPATDCEGLLYSMMYALNLYDNKHGY